MWPESDLRYGRAEMPHLMSGTSKPFASASHDTSPMISEFGLRNSSISARRFSSLPSL
jgi:hypothetical protein